MPPKPAFITKGLTLTAARSSPHWELLSRKENSLTQKTEPPPNSGQFGRSWSSELPLGLAETFSRPLCSPTSHAAQPGFLASLPTCRSGDHFLTVPLHADLCLRASLPAHPRVTMPIITISSLAGLFLAIFHKLFHLMHNPLMKEVLLLMLTLEVMERKKGTEGQTVKGAARTSRIRWLLDLLQL